MIKPKVLTLLKGRLIDIFYSSPRGLKNSITSNQLAKQLNLRSPENVRVAISELRQEGHLIASSIKNPKGYYLPQTIEEANACILILESRVNNINASIAGMKRGMDNEFGDASARSHHAD